MILLIDNYDSFTWNLVQRLGELRPDLIVRVVRNDKITPDEVESLNPERIIISPGPCTPNEAGVSNELVRRFAGRIPILGVCLGHQCIGAVHGMTVERHAKIMHGKTSLIHHDNEGVFMGVANPFEATRYHSLVVRRDSVPTDGWAISAWTADTLESGETVEVVMGLRRVWSENDTNKQPLVGVQFHPESFLTTQGHTLLANFLELERPVNAEEPKRLS